MNLDAKQKKYLIIGGAVVLGIYVINKWLHSLPKPEDKIQATPEFDRDLVLSKGAKGAEVSELQRVLLKDYSANLGDTGVNKDGIDGDFGILTEVALKKAKGVTEIALKNLENG
jgi:hypothetical protein